MNKNTHYFVLRNYIFLFFLFLFQKWKNTVTMNRQERNSEYNNFTAFLILTSIVFRLMNDGVNNWSVDSMNVWRMHSVVSNCDWCYEREKNQVFIKSLQFNLFCQFHWKAHTKSRIRSFSERCLSEMNIQFKYLPWYTGVL